MQNELFLILGNQLFDPVQIRLKLNLGPATTFFLREDVELCTYFKFHKHKIIFFLSAMRAFAEECKKADFEVIYQKLGSDKRTSYEDALAKTILENSIKKVRLFEIEDKFFERRILALLKKLRVDFEICTSPMFLSTRDEFAAYLKTQKKPFMKTFYERQRRQMKILVDTQGKPLGGQWSFDSENRKALPKTLQTPVLPFRSNRSAALNEVKALCEKHFASHPGKSDNFQWPFTRDAAKDWLHDFLEKRFENFGPYEDALSESSDFVFHSVLTPFLNTGLLTPNEVVAQTLKHAKQRNVPISSVEGFIRQVIGWREFIRGIYQNYSDVQETKNFWNHKRRLTSCWYEGGTGIPPLDNCIRKAQEHSYAHHIERLMVVGSLMVLCEVDPHESYRWFMEMFIDSSDWVMVPNVFGMALFSDGGIFATKPYICGSNYYRKMGGYKHDSWCDAVDGLYWSFLEKHRDFFETNARLSVITKNLDRMDKSKFRSLKEKAEILKQHLTIV